MANTIPSVVKVDVYLVVFLPRRLETRTIG
jgi:hypothetical protein